MTLPAMTSNILDRLMQTFSTTLKSNKIMLVKHIVKGFLKYNSLKRSAKTDWTENTKNLKVTIGEKECEISKGLLFYTKNP